jgi:LPS sulfotransferase NodH
MRDVHDGPLGARRGYALCTTQRSGSNYLCQLLSSTNLLGRPLDYFNGAGRREKGWEGYPDDVEAQIDMILDNGSTSNGVYGSKVFAGVLDALESIDWLARLPQLRLIYLRREDLLAQAISLVIAEQTGAWRSTAAPRDEPTYNARAIARAMAGIARDDARWRLYFASKDTRPLEITYEQLSAGPQTTIDAVASFMGVTPPLIIDPSQVEVAVQRDELNRAWRGRFLAEPAELPAMTATRRPRLTVSIITKDSETRLPRLLAEAREYADEVIVGVDAASADGTLAAASAGADVVYQFRLAQPGQLAGARLLPFDYATGDWILSLDDDESMEETFDALVPDLMRAGTPTHYYFPRKWIVNDDPYEYVHAPPLFPNWAPRMFRNDRSLVWKPPMAHSMYWLQGPGYYDARASILHFEPLWCSPEQRRRKIAAYRTAGASTASEDFYAAQPDALRRPVRVRPASAGLRRARPGVVLPETRELVARPLPPWSASFINIDMPAGARPGETFVVQVTVRNTGELAWVQQYSQWPANAWPMLRLTYALLREGGLPADSPEGQRMVLPRFVAPGDDVTFVEHFTAPEAEGEYVIEWDMISEGHSWFADRSSGARRNRLSVRAG